MPETTKTTKADDDEVIALRAAIREHTGRLPASRDLDFLRKRLADLRTQRDASSTDDKSVVVSISMHGRSRSAASRIADGEGCGVSELVRRALAEFADRHGYKSETSHFTGAE